MKYREIAKAIRDPENQPHQFSDADLAQFFNEAADEIERLRVENERLKDEVNSHWNKYWSIAQSFEKTKYALHRITKLTPDPEFGTVPISTAQEIARITLKEIE